MEIDNYGNPGAKAGRLGFNGAITFSLWKFPSVVGDVSLPNSLLQWGHNFFVMEIFSLQGTCTQQQKSFNGAITFSLWKCDCMHYFDETGKCASMGP